MPQDKSNKKPSQDKANKKQAPAKAPQAPSKKK